MENERVINIGNIGPSILLSQRANPCSWGVVLGELCDNSIDAGATRIDIEFGAKSVVVTDDGCGCDNIEKMLTIGEHYSHRSTKLGRYGVGLKDAACWLWGMLKVSTVKEGMLSLARIDWEKLSKSKTWDITAPEPMKATSQSGTQLSFTQIERKVPSLENIAADLGYTFAPAIMSGRQIRLVRSKKPAVLVTAWQMPPLKKQVDVRFDIKGKQVHLVAGIVADDAKNEKNGFNICHEHRIICNTSFGSNGRSTARFCGRLTLDASWKLSRNKTEVVDEDSDELGHAVFYHCQELLEESAEQAKTLRNTALESSVTEKLRGMLTAGFKEKRNPAENKTGRIEPKNSGKKRKPTGKTQPGNNITSRLAGIVRMEWLARNDGLIGHVDIPGAVIYLNSEHSRLSYHLQTENDEALADACMTLITFEEMNKEEKSKLFKDFTGFVEALSSVWTSQQQDSVQELVAN